MKRGQNNKAVVGTSLRAAPHRWRCAKKRQNDEKDVYKLNSIDLFSIGFPGIGIMAAVNNGRAGATVRCHCDCLDHEH